ncbi:hypothetical protein RRG08_047688 [Elysia crispata]|uniref:Uncharacterized protein n=1 Tax=Elysia crispata TaxID=231223 RepID=A0AAE1BD56_9GAST|nr:hypothetical protein RRG08_047688 [Elysia crispata]
MLPSIDKGLCPGDRGHKQANTTGYAQRALWCKQPPYHKTSRVSGHFTFHKFQLLYHVNMKNQFRFIEEPYPVFGILLLRKKHVRLT